MIGRSSYKSAFELIALGARAADAVVVVIAGISVYAWRFSPDFWPIMPRYAALLLACVPLFAVLMESFGLYRSWRGVSLFRLFTQVVFCWLITVLILISALFLLKVSQDYSRIWLTAWTAITPLFLIVYRSIFYASLRLLRSKGINSKNVLVFGSPGATQELIYKTHDTSWAGFTVVGYVDCVPKDSTTRAGSEGTVNVQQVVLEEAEAFINRENVSEVWISLPLRAEQTIHRILHELRHSTANVRYVPDISSFRLLNHGITEIVGIPMIDLTSSPMTGWNRIIKALLDRTLGLIILVIISPLMLAIAIAIKLTSRGPVFFKQTRLGWDNRKFTIYKFRSMVVHHEENGKVTQATRADARLTKVGAFLRKSSLDELPQFINVLQGRMSIVGPRPHALVHNDQYKELVDDYMKRHKVKPGITGWAQINGYRGETDTVEKMKKRVELDLYYIENWSFWLDIKIIVMTIFRGFFNRNAY